MGWDTMGCTKLLQQFLRDAELHQPSTVEVPVAENAKAADAGSSSNSSTGSSTLEPEEEAPVGDSTAEYASGAEVFYSHADLSDANIWRCKSEIMKRPHEREQFLAPDVFEEIFGMKKENFAQLRRWKQICLKKEHRLF